MSYHGFGLIMSTGSKMVAPTTAASQESAPAGGGSWNPSTLSIEQDVGASMVNVVAPSAPLQRAIATPMAALETVTVSKMLLDARYQMKSTAQWEAECVAAGGKLDANRQCVPKAGMSYSVAGSNVGAAIGSGGNTGPNIGDIFNPGNTVGQCAGGAIPFVGADGVSYCCPPDKTMAQCQAMAAGTDGEGAGACAAGKVKHVNPATGQVGCCPPGTIANFAANSCDPGGAVGGSSMMLIGVAAIAAILLLK